MFRVLDALDVDKWTVQDGLYLRYNAAHGQFEGAGVDEVLGSGVTLTPSSSSRNVIVAQNATTTPLTIEGAANQSADLGIYRDSNGGSLVRVTARGSIIASGSITASGSLTVVQSANLWGRLTVYSDVVASGGITTAGSLLVAGNGAVVGNLRADGTTTIGQLLAGDVTLNSLIVTGQTTLQSTLTASGQITAAGAMQVWGAASFLNSLTTSGQINAVGQLQLWGYANLFDNLTVSGTVLMNGAVGVGGPVLASTQLTVRGQPGWTVMTLYASGGNSINSFGLVQQVAGSNALRWNWNNEWIWGTDINGTGSRDWYWYDNTVGHPNPNRFTIRGHTDRYTPMIGIGTVSPDAAVHIVTTATLSGEVPQHVFHAGYSTLTNRNITMTEIVGASVRNYMMLMGCASGTSSTPVLVSTFASAFGFEGTDTSLSLVTATSASNGATPVRGLTMNNIGSVAISGALSTASTLQVWGASTLLSTLTASGNITGVGQLQVWGATNLLNNLTVSGSMGVAGGATISAGLQVTSAIACSGRVTVGGTLFASGSVSAAGAVDVWGPLTAIATAVVSGTLTTAGALQVWGPLTAQSTLTASGQITAVGAVQVWGAATYLSSLVVSGAVGAAAALDVWGPFTAKSLGVVSGAVTFASTSQHWGKATFLNDQVTSGALSVVGTSQLWGAATAFSTLTVSGQITGVGQLQVWGATNLLNNLTVSGSVAVGAGMTVYRGLQVVSAAVVSGDLTVANSIYLGNNPMSGSLVLMRNPTDSSATGPLINLMSASDTNMVNAEQPDVWFNFGVSHKQLSGGVTLATWRSFLITGGQTFDTVASGTISAAATVHIFGAPVAGTNTTITNSAALWVQGAVVLGNNIVGTSKAGFTFAQGRNSLQSSALWLQPANTGNSTVFMTAATESNAVLFDFRGGGNTTWLSGGFTTQREFFIKAPIYAANNTTAITDVATVAIDGAPGAGSNMTFTNAYALWIQNGGMAVSGVVTLRSAATVSGQLTLAGALQIWGATTNLGAMTVSGAISAASTLDVWGTLTAVGSVVVTGGITVDKASTFTNNVTIGNNSTIAGTLVIGGLSASAKFHLKNTTATTVGMIVQGADSQTGDLFQGQSGTSTNLIFYRIGASGNVTIAAGGSNPALLVTRTAVATGMYATLSLGGGGFTGGTSHFSGNAAGTQFGINTNTSFTGDLINAQVSGSTRFLLDYTGAMTVAGAVIHQAALTVSGQITGVGQAQIWGATSLLNNLTVSGSTGLGGGLTVYGGAQFTTGVSVSGAVMISIIDGLSGSVFTPVLILRHELAPSGIGTGGLVGAPALQFMGMDAGGNVPILGEIYMGMNNSTPGSIGSFFSFGTRFGGAGVENLRIRNTQVWCRQSLLVDGSATIAATSGTIMLAGATTASGTLMASGQITAAGAMQVWGATTHLGAVTVSGAISAASTVDVWGTLTAVGSVVVTGGMTVDKASTFTNNVTIGNNATIAGTLVIGGLSASAKFHLKNLTTTTVAMIVQGADSQTADLFQGQSGTSTNLIFYRIGASGNVTIAAGGSNPALLITRTPVATGMYANLSLGDGGFTGGTQHFSGNSLGTYLGLNAAAGFAGDLANLQTSGATKLKVDWTGALTVAGASTLQSAVTSSGHFTAATTAQVWGNLTNLGTHVSSGAITGAGSLQIWGAASLLSTLAVTSSLTAAGISNSGTYGGNGTAFSPKRFSMTFTATGDYTLAAGEKDALLIDIQTDSVLTATTNIIVPNTAPSMYIVINRNAQAIGFKTATGTAINIASQRAAIVIAPGGTNMFRITPDTVYTV